MEELLRQCSDAIVRTQDGTEFPCNTFALGKSSSVLLDCMHATTLETTADGRRIFPVPGIPAEIISITLDLVHGLRAVETMPEEELELALQGTEVLGCSQLTKALVHRLWMLVRAPECPLELLRKHAPRLLQSLFHRNQALDTLVRRMPLWNDFSLFLEKEVVPLDPQLALFLGQHLVTFFPPLQVLRALTKCLTRSCVTTGLLSDMVASHGHYFHPAEAIQTLRMAQPASGGDPLHQLVLQAHEAFDVAPHQAARIHGSVFVQQDRASALVMFDQSYVPGQHRTLKVASWLTVKLYPTGHVDVYITPWKVDDHKALASSAFQLRVTARRAHALPLASTDNVVEEAWWKWNDIEIARTTQLATFANPPHLGSLARLCDVVRSGPKSLRLDFFFGLNDVLNRPVAG